MLFNFHTFNKTMFSTSWEEAAPVVPFILVLLELPEMNIWTFCQAISGFFNSNLSC